MTTVSLQQEETNRDDGDSAESAGKAPGAFRTISEVAGDLGLQQHVLRFWETKFSQIRPLKRGGGRRYYRPQDVLLIKRIHQLLYTEGYTIRGAQKFLKEQGRNPGSVQESRSVEAKPAAPARPESSVQQELSAQKPGGLTRRQRVILESMLGELKELRSMIRGETA